MLSKLQAVADGPPPADIDGLRAALLDFFHGRGAQPLSVNHIAPGGTLGVFFDVQTGPTRYFVKTHPPTSAHRATLIKEARLTGFLYGDILNAELAEINVNGTRYAIFINDFLMPLSQNPTLPEITALLEKIHTTAPPPDIVARTSAIYTEFWETAAGALRELPRAGLLSAETARACAAHMALIADAPCDRLCHGDLSNKNIMCKNTASVIIDWEDAFWGPAGFDMANWLTFFDQRKYYVNNLLKTLPPKCQSYMLLCVLFKSWISYKNKSYVNNSLSFDERLGEILAL